ncbi:hypothetical protein ACFL27_26040 [candidate division CSSED10-310 bacterium]|uniref:SAM-dependent methyltransferase n=1 Tax=candidate division CSSED10-310 bacterium TaxID=2855610 RepID=A0ABV6Z5D3_UNCC1
MAARGMEHLFAANRDEYLAELGYHWEEARETDRARSCFIAAALRATVSAKI